MQWSPDTTKGKERKVAANFLFLLPNLRARRKMIVKSGILLFVFSFSFCALSSASQRHVRNYKFRRGHGVLTGQEEEEDSLPFYLQSGESDERLPFPMRVSSSSPAAPAAAGNDRQRGQEEGLNKLIQNI